MKWRLHANSRPRTSNIQHANNKKQAKEKNMKGKSEATENKVGTQRTPREQMQDVGDTWWKTGRQTRTGSKTQHLKHETGDQLN